MSQLYRPQTLFKAGGKGVTSQPASSLWSRWGLLFLLAVMLIAAWNSLFPIVILLGLILVAAGVAMLWSRLSLAGVSCQRTLSEHRAFPGESVELKLRLMNRKLLPLPWIQLDDSIPAQLVPEGTVLPPSDLPGCRLLSRSASLLWYTVINWRYRLDCRKRGCYTLGPAVVSSGDIFGFYPRSAIIPLKEELIVYPRIYPVNQLGIPSLFPMGDTVANRRIFTDPTRAIGVRDYEPHDSLRFVHWKASARRQSLQVKVFEPTTTLKVALFLAVDSFPDYSPTRDDDFELAVSTMASIASYAMQQHSSVGVYANAGSSDSGQSLTIAPGGGTGQMINILEALARITPASNLPFGEFLERTRAQLPWGTTLALIISRPSDDLAKQLISLKTAGYKVMVMQIGKAVKPGTDNPDIAWYHILDPHDLAATSDGRMM